MLWALAVAICAISEMKGFWALAVVICAISGMNMLAHTAGKWKVPFSPFEGLSTPEAPQVPPQISPS